MSAHFQVRRTLPIVSLLFAAAIILASCGGNATAGPSSTGSTSKKTLSLTIGVGSAATNYGAFWVAEESHLFQKEGLDIHVVSYNTSGATANMVAAGQVQLQLYTAPLGLELAEHGKPISVVYDLASFNAASMAVIGAKGITSPSQLHSVTNCRIATTAVGTVPYAYAVRYLKVEGLSNCTLISEASVAPLLATVSSGSAQAGVITYSNALGALAKGAVTLLLNPLKVPSALAKKLVPTEYPAFVVFGLRSTVRDNGDAVIRFVRALRQANATLLKTSPTELGTETAPLTAFAGIPASSLGEAWSGVVSQIPTGPKAGFISPSAWNAALSGFSEWNLPGYSATDPALSYKQVVDMSYFDKAG